MRIVKGEKSFKRPPVSTSILSSSFYWIHSSDIGTKRVQ
ncbi:hypothetical protein EW14_1873 [Prochlorococcus sp. MIT 0604]|nr:hypothetical protein EW14_1873 [Prochlorococcus sp. MIT 0604]